MLDLGPKQPKSIGVGDLHSVGRICWQLLIWLPQFVLPMGVCAVLTEIAGEALLKEFANLGLIIIIRNVEHFHLDFDGQRLQKEINIDY